MTPIATSDELLLKVMTGEACPTKRREKRAPNKIPYMSTKNGCSPVTIETSAKGAMRPATFVKRLPD